MQMAEGSNSNNSVQYDTGKFLHINRLIHFALVIGLVMFAGVALYISRKTLSLTPSFNDPATMIAAFFFIMTIILSFLIYPVYKKIAAIPKDIRSALQQYQAYCLIKWSVIQGGALFSAVAILVTKNIVPVCLFTVSTIVLIAMYPSKGEFLKVIKSTD